MFFRFNFEVASDFTLSIGYLCCCVFHQLTASLQKSPSWQTCFRAQHRKPALSISACCSTDLGVVSEMRADLRHASSSSRSLQQYLRSHCSLPRYLPLAYSISDALRISLLLCPISNHSSSLFALAGREGWHQLPFRVSSWGGCTEAQVVI